MIEYAISEIGTYALSGVWYATKKGAEDAIAALAPHEDLYQIIELHFDDLESELQQRRELAGQKWRAVIAAAQAEEEAEVQRLIAAGSDVTTARLKAAETFTERRNAERAAAAQENL